MKKGWSQQGSLAKKIMDTDAIVSFRHGAYIRITGVKEKFIEVTQIWIRVNEKVKKEMEIGNNNK